MSDIILQKLNEFCASNGLRFESIDPEVVSSCSYAFQTIMLSRNRESNPVINFSRSKNDLLFALRFGTERENKPCLEDAIDAMINETAREYDINSFSSGLFAESTKRARCFDFMNNGKGITMIITYENAFKD